MAPTAPALPPVPRLSEREARRAARVAKAAQLKAEVDRARAAFDLGQNQLARKLRISPGDFSRLLSGDMTSKPADKRIRRWLATVARAVAARERAQQASVEAAS